MAATDMSPDPSSSPFAGGPTLKDVLERANKLSKQVEQLAKFIQAFPTTSPLLANAKAAPAAGPTDASAEAQARIAQLEEENARLKEQLEAAE
ncbi:hypothetical protein HDU93_001484, partial [Gonapodya sp. JEL0774]